MESEPRLIAACRRITQTCTAEDVDGMTVDLWTASAIVAVYDKLAPESRARYASWPLGKMAEFAIKHIK